MISETFSEKHACIFIVMGKWIMWLFLLIQCVPQLIFDFLLYDC